MKINKNILLTGAGFSKCFGGFLGTEMHHRLYNIASQRGIELLRSRLSKTEDYEKVFGDSLNEVGKREALWSDIQNAVKTLYSDLDRAFLRFAERRDKALRKFLEGFLGGVDECGFIFTLNQDLLLERWWRGTPSFSMPGLRRSNAEKVYLSDSTQLRNTPFSREDPRHLFYLPTQPEWDKMDFLGECTSFSYIKLHGSMNFSSQIHGNEVMVVGTEKSAQIAREPLLNAGYAALFRQVLFSGNIRLFIVGYRFQDDNINEVLSKALKDHGLKIFIMNPTRHIVDFVGEIGNPKEAKDLLPGFDEGGQRRLAKVAGYFPYHLLEDVFPDANVTDFPAWNEILARYFQG